MNILPKKRWHVRTKENIARVRRDEAKAAEEEKAKQDRIKLAEREARRELLLQRSRKSIKNSGEFEFIPLKEKDYDEASSSGHINFFKEVEDGVAELKQSNKEHDKEQKQEREKYEKQIGYLTYLGQDTNEALGKKSWYDVAPNRTDLEKSEINLKSKISEDPLQLIKKYTSIGKNIDDAKRTVDKTTLYKPILDKNSSLKRKRSSSGSSDVDIRHKPKKSKRKKDKPKKHNLKKRHEFSSENSTNEESEDEAEQLKKKQKLEILRLERIKREKEERKRTEELLSKLKGEKKETPKQTSFKPKYNSQFNPELAKQNYDKNR